MKILGIGVDIIENKRLKKSIKNKSFLLRLFTSLEIKNSKLVKDKSIYFSKKFAGLWRKTIGIQHNPQCLQATKTFTCTNKILR